MPTERSDRTWVSSRLEGSGRRISCRDSVVEPGPPCLASPARGLFFLSSRLCISLRLLQVRQPSALVDAYLVALGHVVHHLAALRLLLAEEVDVHFRSPLQFHFARVQRPSLVRVCHAYLRYPYLLHRDMVCGRFYGGIWPRDGGLFHFTMEYTPLKVGWSDLFRTPTGSNSMGKWRVVGGIRGLLTHRLTSFYWVERRRSLLTSCGPKIPVVHE